MFAVENNGVLWPEGTAGAMWHFISTGMNEARLYYSGKMFRHEWPQQGRYREFHQFGVENIGSSEVSTDIEMIYLAAQMLEEVGIESELHINSIGTALERDYYDEVFRTFVEKNWVTKKTWYDVHRGWSYRVLETENRKDQKVFENAPRFVESMLESSIERHQEVLWGLDDLGVKYIEDHTLFRGMDYYCHTCYEFMDKKNLGPSQSTVLAGGRYDDLSTQLGSPQPFPAVGFAAGIDWLYLSTKMQLDPPPRVGFMIMNSLD